VQLDAHVCQSAVTLVEASRKLVGGRAADKLGRVDKLEKDWDNEAEDMLQNAQPAFSAQPWISRGYKGTGSISPH
jgi:hypothetical protein